MSDDNGGFIVGAWLTAMVLIVVWGFVATGTDNSWRQQIADHGCAEYYLDQNHHRQWRWK